MDPTASNYNPSVTCNDGSCAGPYLGGIYEGGILFYHDGNGGGLVAATSDQSIGAEWGCYGNAILGADGIAIGTGAQNTIDIVNAGCGIAADICANYTDGTYSDWFLPSKDELNLMYLNIGQGNALGFGTAHGNFGVDFYWSSTQSPYDPLYPYQIANDAWLQYFSVGDGGGAYIQKVYNCSVRAIRAF